MNRNSTLAVTLLFCSVVASCSKTPAKTASSAFDKFDLSQIVADIGLDPGHMPSTSFINGYSGIATHIQWGNFSAEESHFPCYEVLQRVKSHFAKGSQIIHAEEGWNPEAAVQASKPVHISVFYTQSGRNGELNLWLFPSEDEKNIDFALHLLEQRIP